MLKKLLMVLALAAMAAYSFTNDSGAVIAVSNAAEPGYAPQISNERGVKVTVTLQSIPSDAKGWDFQVTLESHTQDLSEDLARSAALIADGRQYLPVGWEGAPPGGHHRKGLLRFNAIAPQPRTLELQIRLAGDTSPRSFRWSLK